MRVSCPRKHCAGGWGLRVPGLPGERCAQSGQWHPRPHPPHICTHRDTRTHASLWYSVPPQLCQQCPLPHRSSQQPLGSATSAPLRWAWNRAASSNRSKPLRCWRQQTQSWGVPSVCWPLQPSASSQRGLPPWQLCGADCGPGAARLRACERGGKARGVRGRHSRAESSGLSPADLGVRPVPRLLREPSAAGGQEHPAAPAGAGGGLER